MYVCMRMCACALVRLPCVGNIRDEKTVLDSLELDLQAIVSQLVWLLGSNLGSFPRPVLSKTSTYSYLLSSLSNLKQIVKRLVRPVIMLKVKYCLIIVGNLKFTCH